MARAKEDWAKVRERLRDREKDIQVIVLSFFDVHLSRNLDLLCSFKLFCYVIFYFLFLSILGVSIDCVSIINNVVISFL